ncbi:Sugar carrier protein A [Sesamum angolense]|uniref:Sugar carrier protein A n=1 Tax=Sesamum angolense TaxID=2727404 RepID=A0AAE2C0I8_9LAMI|nr:Sugar carrier protein A [Sesamum angolense]
MAGGSFGPTGVATERAAEYKGRVTAYVIVACLVAALGGSIFGYDIGISGPSSIHIVALSCCLVSLVASPVTRKYGRRGSIICGGISFMVGAALDASAVNLAMLIVGRIMLGVGIGFGNQAVPLYLSELAPTHLRGALNMMFQLATTLGIFTANMINYGTEKLQPWGWRLSLGLAAVPATLMTVGGILLPETPNSLIERGFEKKGKDVLEKIRGTTDVHAELQDIIDASELAKSVEHPFRNILERRNRPVLMMAIFMPTFQILTGINSILFYAPVLFQSMGFGGNASLYSSALTGAVLASSTFISIATVIVSIILGLKFHSDQELQGILSASCGGRLPIRRSFRVVLGATRVDGAERDIPVRGWITVMTIFVYLFLPETKGVPIEEMAFLWKKHWFWKRIVL